MLTGGIVYVILFPFIILVIDLKMKIKIDHYFQFSRSSYI
nr:MAG TPA: hypothetical protein [Caudoviricetes sp.]